MLTPQAPHSAPGAAPAAKLKGTLASVHGAPTTRSPIAGSNPALAHANDTTPAGGRWAASEAAPVEFTGTLKSRRRQQRMAHAAASATPDPRR